MEALFPAASLPVIKNVDILIEGNTFLACSRALDFARQGRKVLLLDTHTCLGWEMTTCLRPWLAFPPAQAALDRFSILPAILNETCCSFGEKEAIFHPDRIKIALEDCLLQAGCEMLYSARVIDRLGRDGVLSGVVIGDKSGRQVIECSQYFDDTVSPELYRKGKEAARLWRTLEFSGVDTENLAELVLPDFLGIRHGGFRFHQGIQAAHHCFVEFPIALETLRPFGSEEEYACQMLSYRMADYLLNQVGPFRDACWAGESYESFPDGSEALLTDLPGNRWKGIAGPVVGSGWMPPADGYRVREDQSSQLGKLGMQMAPEKRAPVLASVDALVVGGGTSGVAAAYTSAKNESDTLVIEMNPRLGGTGTIGGVQSYWYGRNAGYSKTFLQSLSDLHNSLSQPIPSGDVPRWNIEVKAWLQLNMLHDLGVHVLFNSRVITALMEGNRITGVIVDTPEGVFAFQAKIVIDATGDGDVAVFCGVPTRLGSKRNRSTMWYSLAQFVSPGQTQNNFTSMVESGNVLDATRAILSGRRRGGALYDHGAYLCTRESRRVEGEYCLTLTDQLLRRHFPDVIGLAFSNYDVKGHTDSDWLRCGLIPPNMTCEIPLRSILPRGIEHLLVVGKAISASHAALPSLRMQRDVENLGAAAGLIAALAVSKGQDLRAIPVAEIQQELVRAGLLPTETIQGPGDPVLDLPGQLVQLGEVYPLYTYSDMDINQEFTGRIPFVDLACSGKENIPQINAERVRSSGNRRLLLAQLLALMGDAGGAEDLLGEINRQLAGGTLPAQSTHIRNSQLPPDQGAMPDLVYLLYSLGMLHNERSIPIYEKIAGLLQETHRDDVFSGQSGLFYYIDALCYGAERLGDPRMASALSKLQAIPYLQNQVSREAYQADYLPERLSFLEISIAQAMLRCGFADGLPVLIEYLQDTRANPRERAHQLLAQAAGIDFGSDFQAWKAWYQSGNWSIHPNPDGSPTEAMWAGDHPNQLPVE